MTLRPFILGLACLAAWSSPAMSTPYCSALLEESLLERRYQRLAPIFNSTETGWIFGSDQMDDDYVLNAAEQALLADIVSEFEARGARLAILVAPPRPVVAGQEVVDQTTGQPGHFDMNAHAQAFQQMIRQLNDAGAVAPDLLDLTLSQPEIRDGYYFHRDTHWTNAAAAHSALALARMVSPEAPDAFEVASLPVAEAYEERGSLSDIVRASCDMSPDAEPGSLLNYTDLMPGGGDLLSDTGSVGSNVVLLGTSFSDRYQRDQYQTADALSAALGSSVLNLSVSGGGMIGPMETYILTGRLDTDQPDLIIWEFPYTYSLTEVALRQVLGALRRDHDTATAQAETVEGGQATFLLADPVQVMGPLGLRTIGATALDIVVRLEFADGSRGQHRLRRKSRMAEVATLDEWWLDIGGYDADLHSVTVEFRGDVAVEQVELLLGIDHGS